MELAPGDVQLAVPHCQPDGQQFPPTEGSQVDQPVAQAPVGDVRVAAAPIGTTMVTPLLTIVVEDAAGQLKDSQFRPVWPRLWRVSICISAGLWTMAIHGQKASSGRRFHERVIVSKPG